MALTTEEKNKIIEEETLRNEIKSEFKNDKRGSDLEFGSLLSGYGESSLFGWGIIIVIVVITIYLK